MAAALLMMGALALAGCSSGGASGTASSGAAAASGTSAAASAASEASTAGSQVTASDAAAQAGNEITVTVAMKEAVTKATDVDTPLQFAEETIDVQAPAGTSALEFLKGTGREVDVQGEGANAQVIAIGGLENGDAGEGSHWAYLLNDAEQTGSPAECIPQDGDTLTWTFVK